MQSIAIQGYTGGTKRNKKPFLIVDDAFVDLYNAYVFREEVRKREGVQLLGRLRRVIIDESIAAATGAGNYTIADILSSVRATESNAEIEPGSVVITFDPLGINETIFKDQGDGTLTRTSGVSYQITTGSYIDYVDSSLILIFSAAPGAGITVNISYNYYPALPSMGISTRETSGVNQEQTIFFDTKYVYIHNGSDFIEFIGGVTWNGTDSDFFWTANYRGSSPEDRLFFATNFVVSAGSPMRYTDGSTWNNFTPIVAGSLQTNVLTNALAAGSVAYANNLFTTPIIPGSVRITVSNGVNSDVIFKDTPEDGTLVSSGLNSGTIVYSTGAITLTFNPALPGAAVYTVTAKYSSTASYMFSSRILIPYYGRLVALNTYEGAGIGSSVNIYNRCRYSQIGSPVSGEAWRSDVFGKGGFIDAPVNEEIISARFYKSTLIVFFERSTWVLNYIGEYGTPFIWERISSDYGSESPFSTILFDGGILAVGDKAIVSSSASDVQRIDLDIPDTVFSFRNEDDGVFRVQGARNFQRELVYWTYVDSSTGRTYPNRMLVYNYRNNTFSFFRNSITSMGDFLVPDDVTWDRFDIFWDDYLVTWDSSLQKNYPVLACGNQVGFMHVLGYPDVEVSSDSTINANDQESLSITDVVVTTVTTLTIPNHNLESDEFIYITGLKYLTKATSALGSTTLNDKIYIVKLDDADPENKIILMLWDISSQSSYDDFTVTNVGEYIGGGVVALFPNMSIQTKDFNPMKQVGQNIKTSYIDFLFDSTPNTEIAVNMRMNTSANAQGNLSVGNKEVETTNSKTGYISNITQANPCEITSFDHGLLNGDQVIFSNILGTIELNANMYTVTFVTTDVFSIGVDSSGYGAYVSGGNWQQANEQYFTLTANYAWHRFFATCYGQYLSLQMQYSNDQMNQLSTHQQNFVLNAMQIYYLPAGRNIFGK